MKSLQLFNSVISKKSKTNLPFISNELGIIILPEAVYAKDEIIKYYENEKLSGNDLNKTFHKSWKTIKESSNFELTVHQIMHYITGYGTNFEGELYIPNEVLNVPEVNTLKYKVIKGISNEEMTLKCLILLSSGIAMKQETITILLDLLIHDLKYKFTGNEIIRNKEAQIIIADSYGFYPKDSVEFLRYVIFKSTGQTLLIKNFNTINLIQTTTFDPSELFKKYGLKKLSMIFNRFKPIFLAYKKQSIECKRVINRISKLSKKYHKPMKQNVMNMLSQGYLDIDDIKFIEDNTTIFHIFKALQYCNLRLKNADTFTYNIRNGKTWTKSGDIDHLNIRNKIYTNNEILYMILKKKYDFTGRKVYIPNNVIYALPTSEKQFVGNVPMGTKFISDKMAVGIYWENSWGANDLDLSSINIYGKVGWDATYRQNNELLFSGDITHAEHGAVEYMYANDTLKVPALLFNNVYSGEDNSGFKIIIGEGDDINKDYMMNPNNLFVDIKTESVQKQSIIGMLLPENDKQVFVLMNIGAGSINASYENEVSDLQIKALYQKYTNMISFNKIIKELGAEIVEDSSEANYDFSLDNLEKDSFIKFFE